MALQPTDFRSRANITDFASLQKVLAMGSGRTSYWGTREVAFSLEFLTSYKLTEICELIHTLYLRNVDFSQEERKALALVVVHVNRLYRQANFSLQQRSLMIRIIAWILDWFRYANNAWAADKMTWEQLTRLYTALQCAELGFVPQVDTPFVTVTDKRYYDLKARASYAVQPSPGSIGANDIGKYLTDDNLLLQVFKVLDIVALSRLRGVSKEWNRLASDCSLYHPVRCASAEECVNDRTQQVALYRMSHHIRNGMCSQHHYRIPYALNSVYGYLHAPAFFIYGDMLFVALLDRVEIFDTKTHTSIKTIDSIPGNVFFPPLNEESIPFIAEAFDSCANNKLIILKNKQYITFWSPKTFKCLYAVKNKQDHPLFTPSTVTPYIATRVEDNGIKICVLFVEKRSQHRWVTTMMGGPQDISLPFNPPFAQGDFIGAPHPFGVPQGAFIDLDPSEIEAKSKWFQFNHIYFYSPKRIHSYYLKHGQHAYTIEFPPDTYLIDFEQISKKLLACQVRIVGEEEEVGKRITTDCLQFYDTSKGKLVQQYHHHWMYQHGSSEAGSNRPFRWEWCSFPKLECVQDKNMLIVLGERKGTTFHLIDKNTGIVHQTIATRDLPNDRSLTYDLIQGRLVVQIKAKANGYDKKTSLTLYNPYDGTEVVHHPNLGNYALPSLQNSPFLVLDGGTLSTIHNSLFISPLTGEILGTRTAFFPDKYDDTYICRMPFPSWDEGKLVVHPIRLGKNLEFDLLDFSTGIRRLQE